MDLSPYMGTIVTIVLAFGAFYGMVATRLAKTEQKIDDLADDVKRHNGVIERVFVLESDMRTAFKRIDELKAADEGIHSKIDDHLYGGR